MLSGMTMILGQEGQPTGGMESIGADSFGALEVDMLDSTKLEMMFDDLLSENPQFAKWFLALTERADESDLSKQQVALQFGLMMHDIHNRAIRLQNLEESYGTNGASASVEQP